MKSSAARTLVAPVMESLEGRTYMDAGSGLAPMELFVVTEHGDWVPTTEAEQAEQTGLQVYVEARYDRYRNAQYTSYFMEDGVKTVLPSLGNRDVQAGDVNDSGQILVVVGNAGQGGRSYIYQDGEIIDLGNVWATAMNNLGQVAGFGWDFRGFFWEDGQFRPLLSDAVENAWGCLAIWDMNDAGVVVGCIGFGDDASEYGWVLKDDVFVVMGDSGRVYWDADISANGTVTFAGNYVDSDSGWSYSVNGYAEMEKEALYAKGFAGLIPQVDIQDDSDDYEYAELDEADAATDDALTDEQALPTAADVAAARGANSPADSESSPADVATFADQDDSAAPAEEPAPVDLVLGEPLPTADR